MSNSVTGNPDVMPKLLIVILLFLSPAPLLMGQEQTRTIEAVQTDLQKRASIPHATACCLKPRLFISGRPAWKPPALQNKKTGSLGMSLMEGLSEDLNGKFSVESDNVTTITISFDDLLSVKPPAAAGSVQVSKN